MYNETESLRKVCGWLKIISLLQCYIFLFFYVSMVYQNVIEKYVTLGCCIAYDVAIVSTVHWKILWYILEDFRFVCSWKHYIYPAIFHDSNDDDDVFLYQRKRKEKQKLGVFWLLNIVPKLQPLSTCFSLLFLIFFFSFLSVNID